MESNADHDRRIAILCDAVHGTMKIAHGFCKQENINDRTWNEIIKGAEQAMQIEASHHVERIVHLQNLLEEAEVLADLGRRGTLANEMADLVRDLGLDEEIDDETYEKMQDLLRRFDAIPDSDGSVSIDASQGPITVTLPNSNETIIEWLEFQRDLRDSHDPNRLIFDGIISAIRHGDVERWADKGREQDGE